MRELLIPFLNRQVTVMGKYHGVYPPRKEMIYEPADPEKLNRKFMLIHNVILPDGRPVTEHLYLELTGNLSVPDGLNKGNWVTITGIVHKYKKFNRDFAAPKKLVDYGVTPVKILRGKLYKVKEGENNEQKSVGVLEKIPQT